jgi:hypothetical protein
MVLRVLKHPRNSFNDPVVESPSHAAATHRCQPEASFNRLCHGLDVPTGTGAKAAAEDVGWPTDAVRRDDGSRRPTPNDDCRSLRIARTGRNWARAMARGVGDQLAGDDDSSP